MIRRQTDPNRWFVRHIEFSGDGPPGWAGFGAQFGTAGSSEAHRSIPVSLVHQHGPRPATSHKPRPNIDR